MTLTVARVHSTLLSNSVLCIPFALPCLALPCIPFQDLAEDVFATIADSPLGGPVVETMARLVDKLTAIGEKVPLLGPCFSVLHGLMELYKGAKEQSSFVQTLLGRLSRLGATIAKFERTNSPGLISQVDRFRKQLNDATSVVKVHLTPPSHAMLHAAAAHCLAPMMTFHGIFPVCVSLWRDRGCNTHIS